MSLKRRISKAINTLCSGFVRLQKTNFTSMWARGDDWIPQISRRKWRRSQISGRVKIPIKRLNCLCCKGVSQIVMAFLDLAIKVDFTWTLNKMKKKKRKKKKRKREGNATRNSCLLRIISCVIALICMFSFDFFVMHQAKELQADNIRVVQVGGSEVHAFAQSWLKLSAPILRNRHS